MSLHLNKQQLEAGLDFIQQSPRMAGTLEMIVVRPTENEREVLDIAKLDVKYGVEGDCWFEMPSSSSEDGGPHPDKQVTVMNTRVVNLVAQSKDRWALAGDQLYTDLDLSKNNLKPGSRLAIGDAILEVTAEPHTGCKKFVERYGLEAMKFVNSAVGKEFNMRGINTKVVRPGIVRTGDKVEKLPPLAFYDKKEEEEETED